jgi:hypothetical protein
MNVPRNCRKTTLLPKLEKGYAKNEITEFVDFEFYTTTLTGVINFYFDELLLNFHIFSYFDRY